MFQYYNHSNAQDAQKPITHPYDPVVEKEYETLIKSWKQQLIDNTPQTPNKEYVKLAWMRLIDHYLDQQWLDSKQMLQCAQAWSARDSLSLTEAVHTMNILSLKLMQRSLDARQELLQALGDPDMMVSFGIYSDDSVKPERFSLAGSEEEVHAPLLVRHTYDSTTSSSCEEKIIAQLECGLDTGRYMNFSDGDHDTYSIDETDVILDAYSHEIEEGETDYLMDSEARYSSALDGDLDLAESDEEAFCQPSPRLYTSVSSPQILSISCDDPSSHILRRSTSWKEIYSEDDTRSVHSNESQLGNQWKSWFGNNHRSSQTSAGLTHQEFANEKVEADDVFFENEPFPLKEVSEATRKPSIMRSESSISTFRPISNNLAPRCQQSKDQEQGNTHENSFRGYPDEPKPSGSIKMIKSKSFPTKSSLISSFKKPSSPPPVPHKERRGHSTIRSIVRKKVSFSKIFGGRKGSTSTTFTTEF